ncbi:MAG: Ca-activated chloride channel [Pyrinomonadaceae bacterium]|jgi:VWFA-related protein|nr:Ca-activated chloride channel [Pyrinomonadaceae bacterium]
MGRLASANSESRTGAASFRLKRLASRSICVLSSACLLFCFSGLNLAAQSGRLKKPASKSATKKPQTSAGPVAEPSPPAIPNKTPPSSADKANGEIDSTDIVRVSSNLVPIPVSVFDARGIALTGLRLEDFELRVDGQLRNISDLTRTETNVRMAMLFDNSGSIDFAREFEKQAAKHFFRKVMRPVDEAAIFSIGSDNYLAQPLTKDVSLLERTIESFARPEGSTSLFDAIIEAAAYLRPYTGRRVLVIVSDGVETTSRNDFETTIRQVLADDCQIFIVQTGLYEGANLRALAAERRMEQLSGQTGGAVYVPKTTNDLDVAFQQIAADLAQQYVLSFYPGEERRDGRFHLIDLRVKARKDVRVRARKGYYSPKPSNVATNDG